MMNLIQTTTATNESIDKKFKTFFEKGERLFNKSEPLDLDKVLEIFRNVFTKYNKALLLPIDYEEEPIYTLLKNIENNHADLQENNDNNNNIQTVKTVTGDEAFFEYLKEFYTKTNYEYFHFMLKFILMFRQSINKLKRQNVNDDTLNIFLDPNEYYTKLNSPECIPDMCNDFIMEFMEPNDYFGMDTMELIEIIQHFCYWLFIKNFTTSRLSLV